MAYPDKTALKILFDTYWTSKGWRSSKDQTTPPDAFVMAKKSGIMFDKIVHSHDTIIANALVSVRSVRADAVADAFVASLTSRRLDLRSALGSYAFLRHLPEHTCVVSPRLSKGRNLQCDICGEYAKEEEVDLNILNFERFKWAGVRHLDPLYAGFDLSLFRQYGHTQPTPADKALLKSLIGCIENAALKTTAPQIEKFFPKELSSNKSERDQITAILGITGILGTKDHPGFRQAFFHFNDRKSTNHHFEDMTYPASWWRRSDGINFEAIDHWFGHLL